MSQPRMRSAGLRKPGPPGIRRAMRGSPRMLCQSYGLTEVARTRTSTSSSAGTGWSISMSSSRSAGPNERSTNAFIFLTPYVVR